MSEVPYRDALIYGSRSCIVEMHGVVDRRAINRLKRRLPQAVALPKCAFDLSGVSAVDSGFYGVLLGVVGTRKSLYPHAPIVLVNVPTSVRKMLRLARLEKCFVFGEGAASELLEGIPEPVAKEASGMSVREAARKGGETTLQRYGPDYYSTIGRKGGEVTARRHGPRFYEEIGRKGGQRVRELIQLAREVEKKKE